MTFWHFGYIDPGSGSLLLQVIFGGILGFIYVARGFLARLGSKLMSLLTRRRNSVKSEDSDQL